MSLRLPFSIVWSLLVLLTAPLATTAQADQVVKYRAEIGPHDLRNSKGVFLPDIDSIKARDILLQDRFNYHQANLQDPHDTDEGIYRQGKELLRKTFESKDVQVVGGDDPMQLLREGGVFDVSVTQTGILIERSDPRTATDPKSVGAGPSADLNSQQPKSGAQQLEQTLGQAQAAMAEMNSKANVDDPEPGKFGGPDTDVIIEGAALGFVAAGDSTLKMTIRRGQPLVADGSGSIPGGTKIFPIRVKTSIASFDYYFYVDPFGDWQSVSANKPSGNSGWGGMAPVN